MAWSAFARAGGDAAAAARARAASYNRSSELSSVRRKAAGRVGVSSFPMCRSLLHHRMDAVGGERQRQAGLEAGQDLKHRPGGQRAPELTPINGGDSDDNRLAPKPTRRRKIW